MFLSIILVVSGVVSMLVIGVYIARLKISEMTNITMITTIRPEMEEKDAEMYDADDVI